jgi:dUTPase
LSITVYLNEERIMARTKVKIDLLSEEAQVPSRAHKTDTGYDLTMIGVDKIVGDVIFFKTGISIQPSKGYYFEVVPRSSISKLPLSMANSVGIIDETYTGEIILPVRVTHSLMGSEPGGAVYPNGIVKIFGAKPQTMTALSNLILRNKPKLFQAILKKRNDCDFLAEGLDDTSRGEGGFGSTDVA